MSLAERRWLRLVTLCLLYAAQGIPWGFTATTIPAYLGSRGLSRESIGIALAATTLPYAFKWVWGPIIDSFTIPRFGRRRPWIVLAQLLMAITIGALIAIPDLTADLKLLAWMILIHTVFNALQDVAVDGLAIDLLSEGEHGRANGLMYASKYGGGLLGGAGMSWVIYTYSFTAALTVQVVVLLAIMMVPLLVRERAGATVDRPRVRDVLRGFVEVFAVRSALMMAVVTLTINVALGLVTANAFALYTQRLGWTQLEYTSLVGGLGLLGGFGGSIAGGFFADLVGTRRLAATASLAMAAGWLGFALIEPWWTNDDLAYAFAIYEVVCTGVLQVSLFALCMQVSWPKIAASQFSAYMALLNFSTSLGYRLTAALPDDVDYRTCYFAAAGVQVVVTSQLLWIDPRQTRRELPRADGAPLPRRGWIAVAALGAALVGLTTYVVWGLVA